MEEQVAEMEKIAETDALKHEVAEARTHIEQDMRDPAKQSADAAGEVGLVKALWDTALSRKDKIKDLTFKDIKATAAAALSVIPILGEAGTAANIGKAMTAGKNVANVEKATWAGKLTADMVTKKKVGRGISVALDPSRGEVWKKFGKSLLNIPENPVNRFLAHPIGSASEAGKASYDFAKKAIKANTNAELKAMKVARGLAAAKTVEAGKNIGMVTAHSLLHKIDPFPDVPPQLAMVAGLAEFVLPGANLVPALWQLGRNKIEWAKMYGGMALDMGKVVMNRLDGKLTIAKKPDMMAAAGAFV